MLPMAAVSTPTKTLNTADDWAAHYSQLFNTSPTSLHASLVARTPSAAAASTPVTLFMSAFLTHTRNVHRGAFAYHRRSSKGGKSALQRSVEELVDSSPGLCHGLHDGSSRLLIVHDQPDEQWQPAADGYSGVELHVIAAEESTGPGLGNDRRWLLFERLLRRDARWDCAFAMDLTDVRVLAAPPCASLVAADRLAIISDDTHHCCRKGIRAWLMDKAHRTGYNASWSDALRRFLKPSEPLLKHHLWNCGAVGGARGAFLAALGNATSMMRAHWERFPHVQEAGLDMLVWNEIAISRTLEAKKPPITGYPLGPANVPVNAFGPWAHVPRAVGRCPGECRLGFINATAGRYWFTHKPPTKSPWLGFYQSWSPCPQAAAKVAAARAASGWDAAVRAVGGDLRSSADARRRSAAPRRVGRS